MFFPLFDYTGFPLGGFSARFRSNGPHLQKKKKYENRKKYVERACTDAAACVNDALFACVSALHLFATYVCAYLSLQTFPHTALALTQSLSSSLLLALSLPLSLSLFVSLALPLAVFVLFSSLSLLAASLCISEAFH